MGRMDALWKGVLEELFDDILRFVFPRAEQHFDFEGGIEFLDKELPNLSADLAAAKGTRFVDKLVRVGSRSGKKRCLLFHMEVQGDGGQKRFGERMFRYYYRILDRGERPVIGIAIFTGKRNRRMPGGYRHSYLGTRIVYRYNVLRLSDYSEAELLVNNNPFALVILAAKCALCRQDRRLVDRKLAIVRNLLERKNLPEKKARAVSIFLNNIIDFDEAELRQIYEHEYNKLTKKENTMTVLEELAVIRHEDGLRLGRRQGRRQAKEKIVKSLLSNTRFTAGKIADLSGASLATVRRLEKRVRRK
jgi:hypothetical protein